MPETPESSAHGSESQLRRDEAMAKAEAALRRHAQERGLNWDELSDQEREDFVDRLLHEP